MDSITDILANLSLKNENKNKIDMEIEEITTMMKYSMIKERSCYEEYNYLIKMLKDVKYGSINITEAYHLFHLYRDIFSKSNSKNEYFINLKLIILQNIEYFIDSYNKCLCLHYIYYSDIILSYVYIYLKSIENKAEYTMQDVYELLGQE